MSHQTLSGTTNSYPVQFLVEHLYWRTPEYADKESTGALTDTSQCGLE